MEGFNPMEHVEESDGTGFITKEAAEADEFARRQAIEVNRLRPELDATGMEMSHEEALLQNNKFDVARTESKKMERNQSVGELVGLAKELVERQETFPFPGIDQESYAKMKEADQEYPGYTTPIDELIARLKGEGMKVALGAHPESGNIYILPAGSNDIENDGVVFPRHLQASEGMDDDLKNLILKQQSFLALTRGK
jgi:hypothetical protein